MGVKIRNSRKANPDATKNRKTTANLPNKKVKPMMTTITHQELMRELRLSITLFGVLMRCFNNQPITEATTSNNPMPTKSSIVSR